MYYAAKLIWNASASSHTTSAALASEVFVVGGNTVELTQPPYDPQTAAPAVAGYPTAILITIDGGVAGNPPTETQRLITIDVP